MKFLKMFALLFLGVLCTVFSGCSSGSSTKVSTGYDKDVIVGPNGEFEIKNKIDDSKATKSGLVYHVELGKEEKTKDKITRITAMYGGQPIEAPWKCSSGVEMVPNMARINIDYSQENYIKETYEDKNGNPLSFGDHFVRFKTEADGNEKGKITRAYVYRQDKKTNSDIISRVEVFTYDKNGKLSSISYTNEDGQPIKDNFGAQKMVLSYDEKNPSLVKSIEFRDHNDNLITEKAHCAKLVYEYDKQGRIISRKCYNSIGDLSKTINRIISLYPYGTGFRNELVKMTRAGIYAKAETKYTYDDKNPGPVKINFFGADGEAVALSSSQKARLYGVHEIDISYDALGNVNDLKFKTIDDQPASHFLTPESGPDEIKFEYDSFGNISKISLLKEGNPVNVSLPAANKFPFSTIEYKYDENHLNVLKMFYDADGNHAFGKLYGKIPYCGFKYSYNESGNLTNTEYVDEEENVISYDPAKLIEGKWKTPNGRGVIFENGNVTFIENNKPVDSVDGRHIHITYKVTHTDIDKDTGKGKIQLTMNFDGKSQETYESTFNGPNMLDNMTRIE